MSHNYQNLAWSQFIFYNYQRKTDIITTFWHIAKILFDVHQPTIVPHHCIKYEQNQTRDLGDIGECDVNES